MNRRTLFKTAILSLSYPIPNPNEQLPPLPKFHIGDCVEFIRNEDGHQEYERGYICGVILPSYSQSPAQTEWEYHFYIEDSSYKPCIGLIAEYPESWLRPIQNPKYFGLSHPLVALQRIMNRLVKL